MNRIYCAVGKIIETTQSLEMNIGEICEIVEIVKEFSRHDKMSLADFEQVKNDAKYLREKMETMTFGQMIGIVYESRRLSFDEINELKELLEKRNYFAHEYFKFTKFENHSEESFILEEFDALKEYLADLKKMLNRLEIIKSSQKERLDYLCSKAGF